MATNPLKKLYFSIIVFTIIDFLLVFLVLFLIFKEINNSSQNFLKTREKINILAQQKENFEKIKIFYRDYEEDFKKIENCFVDAEVPLEFINFLEKNAQDCQLQLKINSLIKNQDKDSVLPFLSFQLSFQGNFSNFLKFLEKIENGPYLIETSNLNVHSVKENIAQGDSLKENEIFLTINVVSK